MTQALAFSFATIAVAGAELILVPLDAAVRHQPRRILLRLTQSLQEAAKAMQIEGEVVTLWDAGGGRLGYIAPPHWHSYLSEIELNWISSQLDPERTLVIKP